MEYTREIDHTIYSRKALIQAREAYKEYCNVRITPSSSDSARVTVSVALPFQPEARQVVLEFWNYFLDTCCQQYLESD